jgi:hypothetical protein
MGGAAQLPQYSTPITKGLQESLTFEAFFICTQFARKIGFKLSLKQFGLI